MISRGTAPCLQRREQCASLNLASLFLPMTVSFDVRPKWCFILMITRPGIWCRSAISKSSHISISALALWLKSSVVSIGCLYYPLGIPRILGMAFQPHCRDRYSGNYSSHTNQCFNEGTRAKESKKCLRSRLGYLILAPRQRLRMRSHRSQSRP